MNRYAELDSLRGVASLSVMIGHHLMVFPNSLIITMKIKCHF